MFGQNFVRAGQPDVREYLALDHGAELVVEIVFFGGVEKVHKRGNDGNDQAEGPHAPKNNHPHFFVVVKHRFDAQNAGNEYASYN